MSSGRSLFEAFFIMLTCILIGFFLTSSIGVGTDMIIGEFTTNGFYDIEGDWLAAQNAGNVDVMQALIIAMIYFIPVFGVANFIVTAVRRQKYDRYGNRVD